MAFLSSTRPIALPAPLALMSRAVASVTRWNDMRVTRKALSALSDHELADLGLDRCDIEAVAKGRRVGR